MRIAAHLCNANIPVFLLDLKTEIADKAKDRILKSKPPLLFDKTKIEKLKTGNIHDNFDNVNDADWIVEAVVERIDIKHSIYEKIFKDKKKFYSLIKHFYNSIKNPFRKIIK